MTNGVLDVSQLHFRVINAEGDMFLSHITVKYCDGCESVWLNPAGVSNIPATDTIDIGSGSSEANKRMVVAFDVTCLTKSSGCMNAAQMFPANWEQLSAKTLRCRVPNDDGIVEYGRDWPR